MIVHLNDGGRSQNGSLCYLVACATGNVWQSYRVTTLPPMVTCRRCRVTVRFARFVERIGR